MHYNEKRKQGWNTLNYHSTDLPHRSIFSLYSTTIKPLLNYFQPLLNYRSTTVQPSSMPDKKKWYKIADHINELEFSDNNIAIAEVKGKKICIGKFQDRVFAFAYKCPHAGGILADGYIDALGNVVCPLHRYKYDMKNGRNSSGEGYYLKNWPVEIRGDEVFVGMEESGGLFGMFK